MAPRPVVLVADDEPFSRSLISSRLTALDVEVCQAEDGQQAFDLLMRQKLDLAIIDLNMPVVDGYELLTCIRGHNKLKHLPVIVLTAAHDQASLQSALEAGATSYLTKPLNWAAFGAHIRHILHLAACARRIETMEQTPATAIG